MRFEKTLGCVVLAGVAASGAWAQDYGDGRGAEELFKPDSKISATVSGFAGGSWRVLTTEPDANIPRSSFDNPMFVDIGDVVVDSGSVDTVEAAWWHQEVSGGNYIRLTMRTENGTEFVPFGAKKNGGTIQAYSYELGGNGNGLDFRQWVTDVDWEQLTISYSYDGGQTVFSDPTIHDPLSGGNWDGTDDLHLGLALPGDGVNWVQVSYKFSAIPTPGSAAVLLGAGALAARRRRA
ncbi:MAG: hypothetical protein IT431_06580 [Phycisphaerales bacterium]|nr:hypothetical protein [Phycisphaerales bacterium]